MTHEQGKKNAALAALALVEPDMTLGIGTGSTAAFFIEGLKEKIAAGWRLRGVPTSEDSHRLASSAGVEIITPDETAPIDLAVDGADEIDPQFNLIKGGGGALLREKIVASAAKEFVVIADKSKFVTALGAFPLPVEIEPFGWALTVRKIRDALAGFSGARLELRGESGNAFTSDGGHLILDCHLGRIDNAPELDRRLKSIPGVIETGIFHGLTGKVILGDDSGAKTISS